MDRTINFDDHTRPVAVEINDETADHLLAPKVIPFQSVGPQPAPEQSFFSGHSLTELYRPGDFLPANWLASDDLPAFHGIPLLRNLDS